MQERNFFIFLKSLQNMKNIKPGKQVKIKTKDKEFQGMIIESYDPNIILLKLNSGYNIGI